MTVRKLTRLLSFIILSIAFPLTAAEPEVSPVKETTQPTLEKAIFGGGCFWCTEAIFERVKGVKGAVSGYCGGAVESPTYKQVCSGTTGHAEVVEITFDPTVATYAQLLEIFLDTHDPTQLNRQGNDHGTQYRSVVFPTTPEQKTIVTAYLEQLRKSPAFKDKPPVTTIEGPAKFWPAEEYHQDYYARNPEAGYCQFVIRPKVEKFEHKQQK